VHLQAKRWLPDRKLIVVMDGGYAAIDFLAQVAKLAHPITLIACFRLDSALYAPAPKQKSGKRSRPRTRRANACRP
jgi:hypothetical protein